MADLRRGQHPHAVLSLGVETGPASWNNKLEANRWNWDERFVPGREDGNPDGNPIAQFGLGLQERAAVEQGLEAAQSRAKNWWPNVPEYNKTQSSAVTPPGSRLKAPSGRVPSPTARALAFAEKGILTRQREKRVEQLSSKLGVDKVCHHSGRGARAGQAQWLSVCSPPIPPNPRLRCSS
jgi:hypothetical protein